MGYIAVQIGNYRLGCVQNGTDKFVEFSVHSHWLRTTGFVKLSALLLTYLLTHSVTYLLIYLLTYLLTHSLSYLLS